MNPHALAGTSPSSWRVCLFRHSDELATEKQRSEIVARGHRATSGRETASQAVSGGSEGRNGAPGDHHYGPGSDGVVSFVDSGTFTAQY